MKLFNHRHVSSRKQLEPMLHRIGNDPYIDWFGIILFAVIVSGVVIFFGYNTFTEVRDTLNEPVTTQKTSSTDLFDVDSLKQVIKIFDGRTTKQSIIIQGSDSISDPSI